MKILKKILALLGILFVVVGVVFTLLGIPTINLIFVHIKVLSGVIFGIALMLIVPTLDYLLK